MSNVIYMYEYWHKKRKEIKESVPEKRARVLKALKLEGLRIEQELKRRKIIDEYYGGDDAA